MKYTVKTLKEAIRDALTELGPIKGGLRTSQKGEKVRQQYKIGKVEDENRELSAFEAEQLFPGSTSAWVEVVPELYPDFPFNDPFSIKKGTLWFKLGDRLRVTFQDMPQAELAEWDPEREDWFELGQEQGTTF
jgi:hypothetical protein